MERTFKSKRKKAQKNARKYKKMQKKIQKKNQKSAKNVKINGHLIFLKKKFFWTSKCQKNSPERLKNEQINKRSPNEKKENKKMKR